MQQSMISVVIVDDHRVVAEGLAKLIAETDDVEVVGIACTLAEATSMLEERNPQVVLLDVAMPDGDGIDAIPRFSAICPSARFLIFTTYAESAVVHRAMQGGANGYVLKSIGVNELLTGIRRVVESATFICEEAAALIAENPEVEMERYWIKERRLCSEHCPGLIIGRRCFLCCLYHRDLYSESSWEYRPTWFLYDGVLFVRYY